MTTWILALLLFGLMGFLGLLQGAIRSSIILVGVILGAVLALPLSPLVRPVFPLIGVSNQIWLWLWPPVLVFALFDLVFTIIAFVVHRQVNLHYKYRTDEVENLRWQRLNKHLGICVGLATGAVYFLVIGLVIYVLGYVTTQVASGDNAPGFLQFLNKARADLKASGFDKTVAKFDPAPEKFYEAADIAGLVYHNPLVHSRLSAYPAFYTLAERPEFQDIASDKDYFEMLQRQEAIGPIIENPKTQLVMKNQEIIDELKAIDLQDLQHFLLTGKSAKYESERILGRWELDVPHALAEVRKNIPNLPPTQWNVLKRVFSAALSGMKLSFAPDNKVYVKAKNEEEIKKLFEAESAKIAQATQAAQAAAQANQSSQGGGTIPPAQRPRGTGATPRSLTARINPSQDANQNLDEQTRQRYNLPRPSPAQGQASASAPGVAAPALPPSGEFMPKFKFAAQGTWKNEGDKYTLTFQEGGKENSVEVNFRGNDLEMKQGGLALLFEKE
jgi:hypothetical protein